METQPNLEDWSDFSGKFLKVEHIKSWPAVVVVTDVEAYFDDKEKARLTLDIEYNNKKFQFELNKTNRDIIKAEKIGSPKELVGKTLVLERVQVRNPATKAMQPSLQVARVE